MPTLFYVIVALFLLCIFLFFWMRWRMHASKGRFAIIVVSTMLTCLLSGLSAMSASLPTAVASKASEAIGWGPIESGVPSYVALALTIAAMFFIYRFGSTTIKNWEAPPRVSEIDLAEKYLDNSIAALSLEQIRLLVKGQSDPLASDAVANWKEKISEPPPPVSTNILLKDMLVEAMTEVRIPDDGWREDGKLWVGEKLGIRSTDTKQLMVLIFDAEPNVEALEKRLDTVIEAYGAFNDFELIALYMTHTTEEQVADVIEVSGKNIRIMSSRKLIYKGLDLINYARTIIDTFERSKVGGTEATLQGSYVELSVVSGGEPHNVEELGGNIKRWLEDTSGKQVAVTGEYGQGKSTGLLKFCYEWARRFVENQAPNERVPLLIEL